jgi:ankyrin repeat protein
MVARRRRASSSGPPKEPADLSKDEIGAFIDAAVDNHAVARAMLRAQPALLEAPWLHRETPLHFLAVENYLEGVRFLAEVGANVNATNRWGDSALIDVATLGNLEMARLLLSKGANPNAVSVTQDNVVHCAVRAGNADLVDLLLQSGASADYTTNIGETILDAVPSEPDVRDRMVAVLRRHAVVVPDDPEP